MFFGGLFPSVKPCHASGPLHGVYLSSVGVHAHRLILRNFVDLLIQCLLCCLWCPSSLRMEVPLCRSKTGLSEPASLHSAQGVCNLNSHPSLELAGNPHAMDQQRIHLASKRFTLAAHLAIWPSKSGDFAVNTSSFVVQVRVHPNSSAKAVEAGNLGRGLS